MALNTAVVGAGYIGITHIEAHRTAGNVRLVGVVEKNEKLGEEIAARYGVAHFSSLDELLRAAPEVQMVDVCVPTWLHEECVVAALNAGKHVLCEKPVTFSLESLQRMQAAAERAGVQLMIAQVIRFWPEYERLQALQAQGAFGKIHMVHARRLCETPNWAPWYADPEKSGGALFDLMLHDLDFVQFFLGKIDRVFATGTQSETGCWNHVQANIRFHSGASAVVESCNQAFGGYPFTMGLQVFGEEMIADYALHAGHNIDEIGTRSLHTYVQGRPPVLEDVSDEDAYANEIRYFADCIERGVPTVRMSPESAEVTLRLVLAVKRSLETGEVVLL